MTKKERILGFAQLGWSNPAIAQEVGCSLNYVKVTKSLAKRPGYQAAWMRRKRAGSPKCRQQGADWQLQYRQRKRVEMAGEVS